LVIKTVRGGYDGRGVVLTTDLAHAREVVSGYLAQQVQVLVDLAAQMAVGTAQQSAGGTFTTASRACAGGPRFLVYSIQRTFMTSVDWLN
jgi:hypothetical protein